MEQTRNALCECGSQKYKICTRIYKFKKSRRKSRNLKSHGRGRMCTSKTISMSLMKVFTINFKNKYKIKNQKTYSNYLYEVGTETQTSGNDRRSVRKKGNIGRTDV